MVLVAANLLVDGTEHTNYACVLVAIFDYEVNAEKSTREVG